MDEVGCFLADATHIDRYVIPWGVNIAARPWVAGGDYWATRCDLMEQVKAAFDRNGISIPFPQRDVHLYQAAASASA